MSDSSPINFDDYRLCEPAFFDDLSLGQKFPIPSRTMTDALFAAFQLASGDNHPIHYDVEYCKAHGHPGLLAHAMQVMIQCAPGAGLFPHAVDASLVAMLEMTGKMLGPVYSGDTVYPMLEISELTEQNSTGVVTLLSTIHNQKGEKVFEGTQKCLLRKRPADT
ncbi:MAG: MaoC family dehydratase [Rhodospirillaceae bacterium]|jgi:acyl dehydratase|nr:MaoC family dehydratase [Rhodospirillaceae bacterium]